jgi:hypothetical protein
MEARDIITESGMGTYADDSLAAALMQKWAPLIDHPNLPKIRGNERKRIAAFIFENEKTHIAGLKRKYLTEDTMTQNTGYYTRFVFPLLRKMLPNLILPEIVSVQPMTGPYGAIFYWDLKFGKSKGTVAAGTSMYDNFNKFYSSEFVDREFVIAADGVNYGGAGAALVSTLQWIPVRPYTATTGKHCSVIDYDAAGAIVQRADDDGAGGFTGAVLSGVLNYASGDITNFKFTLAPAGGHTIKVSYWYNSENNTQIPEGYLDLVMEPITADTNKYKFRISSEAMDDLRSLHGLDGEADLTDTLSQQMATQIDRFAIDEMYAGATALAETFDFTVPAGMEELQHFRRVLTKMSRVSADIHIQSMRGPANWCLFGPMLGAKIAQLQTHGDYHPIFSADYYGGDDSEVVPNSLGLTVTQFGVRKIGTIQSKWVAYQDPFFAADKILLGYKGPSYQHAGYVWAPYIPAEIAGVFVNPEDMSLVKGMRTRYGHKLLRGGKFFGTVTCLGV